MQWMALHYLWVALIIPVILLLYLLKRKYEDRDVASILLWQQMLANLEASRPFQKLKRNLLLILQLLAAALLVLALLQPALPTQGTATTHTVMVIDSSGSMQAKEGDSTRFDLAKAEAEKLIEHLRGDQTMTLIEAGREPKVLIAKSSEREDLQKALSAIHVRQGTADMATTLSLAQAIAATEPDSGIVWIGDGGSDTIPDTQLRSLDPRTFQFVQVGVTKENVALGTFVTEQTEAGMSGLVRIDNHGVRSRTGKLVVYDLNRRLLDAASFTVGAGESKTIQLAALPPSAAYEAVLEVPGDALDDDNRLWSVPFAAAQTRAVLVAPQGNRFLHEVLKLGGNLQVENMNTLPKPGAKPADLWVFDGVVPDKLPEGNVLLIAPNRATDWLPYKGLVEAGGRLELVEKADPLMQYVDVKDVHVAKVARLGELPGMKRLLKSGDDPLIYSGTIGASRVVIVAFDLHQSDFPLRPAFPIFMQNALTWLSPAKSLPIGTGYPGEPMTIPLTPGAGQRTLTLPDGTVQQVTAAGSSFVYQLPEQTGLFVLNENQAGQTVKRMFPVQMREAESAIAPHTIYAAGGGNQHGTENGQSAKEHEQPAGVTPNQQASPLGYQEFTTWFVLLALLILFAEWRVYQRGY